MTETEGHNRVSVVRFDGTLRKTTIDKVLSNVDDESQDISAGVLFEMFDVDSNGQISYAEYKNKDNTSKVEIQYRHWKTKKPMSWGAFRRDLPRFLYSVPLNIEIHIFSPGLTTPLHTTRHSSGYKVPVPLQKKIYSLDFSYFYLIEEA